MEKMNKEQLIEWFIENYGSHPLLAQFISVEEIRQRLNENITEVTYETELGNGEAKYYEDTKIINVDFEKAFFEENNKQSIVHEILHALTYSYSKEKYKKVGLMFIKEGDFSQEDVKTWISINNSNRGGGWKELGRGLNEGITDWLAEEITGIKHWTGYLKEKRTAKLLLKVIGKENVLKKYFNTEYVHQVHDDFTSEELFKEEIEAKYQNKIVAEKINEAVIKMIERQDIITILGHLYNGEKEKLVEEHKEMYDIADKELIESGNDLIQIALREILANKEISVSEKIAFLEMFDKENFVVDCAKYEEVEDFLFHIEETSEMPMNYRMYLYSRVAGRDALERFCIKEGMVNQTNISKADMLADFVEAMRIVSFGHEEANSNIALSEIEYQKIGSHYELVVQKGDKKLKYLLEEKRYDAETGYAISGSNISIQHDIDGKVEYVGLGVDTEEWRNIEEQIKTMSQEVDSQYYMIEIVGKDVIMWYTTKGKGGIPKTCRENYTIGEDGKLEVTQVGEARGLTDDMSKLDIQLMEETAKAGVTTSQMMQVADVMKASLKVEELGHRLSTERGEG